MTARNFLKPRNFKIKAKSIAFESVENMTDLEKKKIYINFVKFLNNHFKYTLFKKNLYEHFHLHCGFIAHYNINGFYGEYFETAATFHYNVNEYKTPANEYSGNLNTKSALSHGELFYAIYEEINGTRYGLGKFYNSIMSNQNWGAYSDLKDLDDAIKDVFNQYLEIWREEIRKSIKAYDKFLKDEKKEAIQNEQMRLDETSKAIEETLLKEALKAETNEDKSSKKQLSLFDFMEVA